MNTYAIIDSLNVEITRFGARFAEENIVGTICAKSSRQAAKLAENLTGRDQIQVVALGSLNRNERLIAQSKPLLGEYKPNNERNAGRKKLGTLKVVNMRLPDDDLEYLNSQSNQAQFVAELIRNNRINIELSDS